MAPPCEGHGRPGLVDAATLPGNAPTEQFQADLMRVLQVVASLHPRFGGPSTAAVAMSSALAARGLEVTLVTTDRGGRFEPPATSLQGVKLETFPQGFPSAWGRSTALAGAVSSLVRTHDVAHIHSLYLHHTWVTSRAACRVGTPYVVRPHGTLNAYHRASSQAKKVVYDWAIERRTLRKAAAVHFTSEAEHEQAIKAGYRLRGVVIPLGVALPQADAEYTRFLEGLVADRLLFTVYGRLTEKKRIPLAIEAFARLGCEEAVLLLAGPDDEGLAGQLLALAEALGAGDRVRYLGHLSRPAGAALLGLSDLAMLPSKDENFGLSVAEALWAGTPVAISEHVALAPQVQASGAGFVLRSDKPTLQALTDAMRAVVGDPEAARVMGVQGAAMARSQFSWGRVAAMLDDLYREIAS